MRKKWEKIVVSVQYSDDFVNTIESVTIRVTYNGGEGKANVTISNIHDFPWNEVISSHDRQALHSCILLLKVSSPGQ